MAGPKRHSLISIPFGVCVELFSLGVLGFVFPTSRESKVDRCWRPGHSQKTQDTTLYDSSCLKVTSMHASILDGSSKRSAICLQHPLVF